MKDDKDLQRSLIPDLILNDNAEVKLVFINFILATVSKDEILPKGHIAMSLDKGEIDFLMLK